MNTPLASACRQATRRVADHSPKRPSAEEGETWFPPLGSLEACGCAASVFPMEILIIEVPGERAAELAVLADEMTEDPRCQLVVRGLDEVEGATAVLITTWDDSVAEEVHVGLVLSEWPARRYQQA